ncbi:MAG: ATP phosphoribosyltransferase regulatory subunit [Bacillota bacterium]
MNNKLITPEGMKDLLFEECETRGFVESTLLQMYKSRGFSQVITPTVEFLDVFNVQTGYINSDKMYKFCDSHGRLIALRPDSTLPIARLASTRLKSEVKPIRLCYNQKMYASEKALRGKTNEVVQSGIEIIGNSSKRGDLEVLFTTVEVLEGCGIENFTIEIGHIGIFKILAQKLGVSKSTIEKLRSLIENKNYPALNDALDEIGDSKYCYMLKQLPRLFGGDEVFSVAKELFGDSQINELLCYLQGIYDDITKLGLSDKISVDLGMVNRTDYYSGIIFRGYIQGHGDAVVSGGRYDNLLKDFGEDLPAIGFAIDVDAVSKYILDKNKNVKAEVSKVLVFGEAGYEMKALLQAKALIKAGLIVENCILESVNEAVEYAKQKNIENIYIVAEEVQLKRVGAL